MKSPRTVTEDLPLGLRHPQVLGTFFETDSSVPVMLVSTTGRPCLDNPAVKTAVAQFRALHFAARDIPSLAK